MYWSTCVQIPGAKEIAPTGLNTPNCEGETWRADAERGITLVDDRVVTRTRAESCQTVLLSAVHLQTRIDSQREAKRRREWDEEAIQPSLYPPVYQYHLSSVMALPPLTLVLVLNTLVILTFPYWQPNLAAASASQPWDKSPQPQVSLTDGFLKNARSRISHTFTKLIVN